MPELQEMADLAYSEVGIADADNLRNNPRYRQDIAKKAEKVMEAMSAYM
jgi:hypothetical protein